MSAETGKLPQIQVARAIAALAVVYFHSYMALRPFNEASAVPPPFVNTWGFLSSSLS